MLASASLREDAALLDLLVEAPQGTLEGLVLSYAYFSQSEFTSHRRGCARNDCSTAGVRGQAPLGRATKGAPGEGRAAV
jgi:hypothetical protein